MRSIIIFFLLAVIALVLPMQTVYAQQEDSLFTNQVIDNDTTLFSAAIDIGRWDALGIIFEVHNDSTTDRAVNDSLFFRMLYKLGDSQNMAEHYSNVVTDTSQWDTLFTQFAGKKGRNYFISLDSEVPKSARRLQIAIKSDSTNISTNQAILNMIILRIGKEGVRYNNVSDFKYESDGLLLGYDNTEIRNGPIINKNEQITQLVDEESYTMPERFGYLRRKDFYHERK